MIMEKNNGFTPELSVILPVYNGEKFLDEAIKSTLNQTFKNFELIIINDCSTDNSLKIIKSYKDKRIKIINNKKNGGFINSLNTGLSVAKGKYIACSNQDDISFPRRFEIEFDYLEKNPHIFLVGSSAIYINEAGDEIRRFRKYDNYKMLAWRLRKSCGIIHPSTMFRNKNVSFDNHFEYHLYYNLLKRGENLTNIPLFLIKFRVHKGSMSIYDKKNQIFLRDEVIEEFKELRDNTSFFNKIYFSIVLFFHYIRTMNEKGILHLNK